MSLDVETFTIRVGLGAGVSASNDHDERRPVTASGFERALRAVFGDPVIVTERGAAVVVELGTTATRRRTARRRVRHTAPGTRRARHRSPAPRCAPSMLLRRALPIARSNNETAILGDGARAVVFRFELATAAARSF